MTCPLPPGPFGLIVADPPWKFKTRGPNGGGRSADRHYRCSSVAEIAEIPVGAVAAEDAILVMWTTPAVLAAGGAHDLARAWGFSLVSSGVWIKTDASGKPSFGMGYYMRNGHEPFLICRRGRGLARQNAAQSDVIIAPRARHSQKPEALQDRLELMYPGARKLEMFARRQRPGWECWGDEA